MIKVDPNGEVEFEFFRPVAEQVFLAGDFNGWNTKSLPMRRTGGGYWRYRLRLAAGTYEFKYVADGEWHVDDAAFGMRRGSMGQWNSVVLVHPNDEKQYSSSSRAVKLSSTAASAFVAVLPVWSDPCPNDSVQEVESEHLVASSAAAFR